MPDTERPRVIIKNSVFYGNGGAGVAVRSNVPMVIENCHFIDNHGPDVLVNGKLTPPEPPLPWWPSWFNRWRGR